MTLSRLNAPPSDVQVLTEPSGCASADDERMDAVRPRGCGGGEALRPCADDESFGVSNG
jgi:hypothetical protein